MRLDLRRLAPAACLLVACVEPRPDDALEPNDDRDAATLLAPGVPVRGRANEGDPDVFAVQGGPDATIEFSIVDRGLDRCPKFQVHDPVGVELVGQARTGACEAAADETRVAPGATLRDLGGDVSITVPAARAGAYFLTIVEDGGEDSVAPLSWDYEVTATRSR